ncbi:phosphate ABC transporter substrate-binding protein PstS [Chitinimonas arctica]|nr:phosphate ABC transporter substrate-binding protein PstS [Chitinimonas arctica]
MKPRLCLSLFAILLHTVGAAASLNGAGSTFAEPLYKKWAELYQKQAQGEAISYEGVGSSEGLARVLDKRIDFAGSDEPLKRSDLDTKGLRQYPIALGAIVPVVNLPGVPNGELKLTAVLLAKIYSGKIKRWRDSEILDVNDIAAAKIPDLPIKPMFRNDGSGSTFVFNYYLSAFSPEWARGRVRARN